MKIIYVLFNDWDKKQRSALAKAGIKPDDGFSRIEVEENAENKAILSLIDGWDVEERSVGTLYDKQDFEKSTLYAYIGAWENGYPQPEKNFGYREVTYDTSNYCKECGTGAVQKAPFQIKKQPNWGKKMMFDLGWVHDEIFVNRQIYESVFKKYGISKMPVLQYKTNVELDDTFQLKIPSIDVAMDMKGYSFELCKPCGEKKYDPQIKGYCPGFKGPIPARPLFKSLEYFGDGGRAFHRIFMSKSLFEDIKKMGLTINVAPVDPKQRITGSK